MVLKPGMIRFFQQRHSLRHATRNITDGLDARIEVWSCAKCAIPVFAYVGNQSNSGLWAWQDISHQCLGQDKFASFSSFLLLYRCVSFVSFICRSLTTGHIVAYKPWRGYLRCFRAAVSLMYKGWPFKHFACFRQERSEAYLGYHRLALHKAAGNSTCPVALKALRWLWGWILIAVAGIVWCLVANESFRWLWVSQLQVCLYRHNCTGWSQSHKALVVFYLNFGQAE